MDKNPADNGEAQNPVEQTIGSLNESSLATQLRGILFSDEQNEGQPEPDLQEGEDQTEDKGFEAEATEETPEATEEEAPQTEDGSEDVLSQTETENAEPEPSNVQKRIDKLTALRKTAEEQVESLKKEVEDYKSKLSSLDTERDRPLKTQENPFSNLISSEEIKSEYEEARMIKYKCEASPEGFSVGETYFDSEQVRNMKINAMQAMEIHLPRQMEFVKAREHWKPLAQEAYPWLKNKESNEYKLAQQVLKTFPQFKNFPDYEMFIGDYVRGLTARTNVAKKIAPKQPPQLSVKTVSSPANQSRSDISARSAETRFARTGSREDLKSAILKFL